MSEPEPIDETPACENCRYWRRTKDLGDCRRDPPKLVDLDHGQIGFWPKTKPTQWCGGGACVYS